jgi:hypothetical protein
MSLVSQTTDRFVSKWNCATPSVVAQFQLPKRVVLNDLTLREGRQVEGLVVTPESVRRSHSTSG